MAHQVMEQVDMAMALELELELVLVPRQVKASLKSESSDCSQHASAK